MVSVVHSATLLIGALFFGALLGHIPMSALAGVLFVTAWRMNEWHSIRYYREHRLTGAIAAFLATMIATVALDLTQAIVVGLGLSVVLFLRQAARLEVTAAPVRWSETGIVWRQPPDAQVVYVTDHFSLDRSTSWSSGWKRCRSARRSFCRCAGCQWPTCPAYRPWSTCGVSM